MGGHREAGILLPIFSLPSVFGIGDLGASARSFIDFLERAGQRIWQFLPIHPVREKSGFSPYDGPSAFAGNPLLISPGDLVEEGWLARGALNAMPEFPPGRIDYPEAARVKREWLAAAFAVFRRRPPPENYRSFCRRRQDWLEDFALFSAVGGDKGDDWREWPEELRIRRPRALAAARRKYAVGIEKIRFEQFLFFSQWARLRRYARRRGIELIGDLPIYVSLESADVWSLPDHFRLTERGDPLYRAGVPPDYFSSTGQLWGNPVYDWTRMRRNGYAWWRRRFDFELSLVDRLRLDHFRGYTAYWRVPGDAATAASGRWVRGPGRSLLDGVAARFGARALIAEDLGSITPPVSRMRSALGLPGMAVLLFAFGSDDPRNPHLPHLYPENLVAYTGTHDNPPVRAWFENEAGPEEKRRVSRYLGRAVNASEAPEVFVRLALESRARTVVIPLQDYLGAGEEARINVPARKAGNWRWRLQDGVLTSGLAARIAGLARACGR
jgi:4-alpha-glucanotransferase